MYIIIQLYNYFLFCGNIEVQGFNAHLGVSRMAGTSVTR